MPYVMMRPIVNIAAPTAAVCKTTPLYVDISLNFAAFVSHREAYTKDTMQSARIATLRPQRSAIMPQEIAP